MGALGIIIHVSTILCFDIINIAERSPNALGKLHKLGLFVLCLAFSVSLSHFKD